MQRNRKTEEGGDHPDRDAQFRYINSALKRYLACGWPVISVDTKKKELIGNYHNAGQQWHAKKEPRKVLGHDFPSPDVIGPEIDEPGVAPHIVNAIGISPGHRDRMIALIRKAYDMGINLFDTTEAYEPIMNEELIGEAIAPFRNNITLCSKFGFDIQSGKNDRWLQQPAETHQGSRESVTGKTEDRSY